MTIYLHILKWVFSPEILGVESMLKIIVSVLGRVLLSSIFLLAGLNKILNWEASVQVLTQALAQVRDHLSVPLLEYIVQTMQQHVVLSLVMGTVCELLGGALVFLGLFVRFGAFLLVLFLVPTTVIFHPFWGLVSPERDMQVVMFVKNAAILGGVLIVWAFGSGFQKFSTSLKQG
ncbi:MAG: DoxX family protein [Chlamydiae bacterium]|nr:DoxX family protein [Chlamydiota bacterium]